MQQNKTKRILISFCCMRYIRRRMSKIRDVDLHRNVIRHLSHSIYLVSDPTDVYSYARFHLDTKHTDMNYKYINFLSQTSF